MRKKIKGKGTIKVHKLTYTIQFSITDFTTEKYETYDLIKINGGSLTTRLGWPQLPFTTKRFVLPAQLKSLKLKSYKEKWTRFPGRFKLAPAQPIRPATQSSPLGKDRLPPSSPEPNPNMLYGRPGRLPLPPIPTNNGVEYHANDVFLPLPTSVGNNRLISLPPAEVASVSQVGGRSIVAIRFHPIRYKPHTGKVEVLSQVELSFKYSLSRQRHSNIERSSAILIQDMYKLMSLVENPEDIGFEFPEIADFENVPPFCPDDPLLKLNRQSIKYPFIVDDHLFIPPPVIMMLFLKDWPYLIITDDYEWDENGTKGAYIGSLLAEFERLARWKTMRGIRAKVISISDIVSNKFGSHWQPGITRDLPEAIRNFLKYAFQYWNTRWCLLGGDINIVPTRHVLGNSSWYYLSKKMNPSPEVNSLYYDSALSTLRFQSDFEFTTDDVFLAIETGEVIRYRVDATTTKPGWYWTENDYFTPSTVPTRHILISGVASLLSRTLIVPQFINMIPSDFYYSSIDSPLYSLAGKHDWDNDNNGIYGWYDNGNPDGVDYGADISVGRAPINSTKCTTDFVDKVLSYELYRDVRVDKPLDADYVRKLYGVGATWGSGWWDGSFEKLRWKEMDGACQAKEDVIAKFRKMKVGTDLIQRVYEDIFFVPRIESNLIVLDEAHIDQMRKLINDGPHFLTVSGHGWWDGCSGFSSTYPTWVHVEGMNNWPHFSIYFVDSCLTNEFDLTHWTTYNRNGGVQAGDPNEVCLGKHLVRHGAGGAIGYLGYTRLGGVGESRELDFWEALSFYGQTHLGNMQDRSREICKDYWSYQAFIMTLMGDPELPIYTQPPLALTVSHTAFVYGKDKLTVSVYHKELPKIDCTVTVCQMSETDSEDKVYFKLLEAVEGHYTFNTSAAKDGKIYITVTAKNFIPYTGKAVKVSEPVSPWKYRTNGFIYDLVRRSASSIYAASGDTNLYALSPTSGLMWVKDLAGPVQDLDAANDGSVLVGLRANTPRNLLIFDNIGNQLHSWNVPEEIWCLARNPAHNTAYVGLRNSGLRAYDTFTGAIKWTRNDLNSIRQIALDKGGNIYAGADGDNPKIVKLSSSTGDTIWSYDLGTSHIFESTALLVETDGNCYVSTRNHELHKVDPAGNQTWKKTGGWDVNNISTAVHSLAKFGTRLYAGCGDGVIHAISDDGTMLWKYDIGDRVDCLVIGPGGTIYAGCWHGICAISADGSSLWFREVTGGVLSLVLIGDRLFGGSRDGWVYQVEVDERIIFTPLIVDGDLVKLYDFVISGGKTRIMKLEELKKIIEVRSPILPSDTQRQLP